MEKYPLEEKIYRIRTGRTISPQYTDWIIDQVCNTPVIEDLKRIGSPDTAQRIRIDSIINYQRDPESITYGDLAVMVTHWYMGDERICPDNILVYIEAFLTSVFKEYKVCMQQGERNSRTIRYLLSMKPMQSFINLAIADYEPYIIDSGLPLKNKEWILSYIYLNRLTKNDKLTTLCSRFLEEIETEEDSFIRILHRYPFGPLMYRNKPEMNRLETLISFFMVPVADCMIMRENRQENINERTL